MVCREENPNYYEQDVDHPEMDAFHVIGLIFRNPVQPPKTHNLRLDENDPNNENIQFHDILMKIFMDGVKILFGENVTPINITKDQYLTVNGYMNSFGYQTEFDYEFDPETNVPKNLRVWFEQLE